MRYHSPCSGKFYLLIFFVCVFFNTTKAQTLTLYSFPPPHPYRWHSPHSLLISSLRNYYAKPGYKPRRLLGHMIIELKKDSTVFLTGMAPDHVTDMKRSVMTDKIGFGIFFKLVAGHLEETSQVQSELRIRTESSKAAFISFKITDSAYNYLRTYIDSFKLKGYDKLYNGYNYPRAGKGCGCTAFGISFLELINALIPEYKNQWAVNIDIPETLIGDTITHKKVSLWRIFFKFRWARPNQPSRKLILYEPYLIYQWVNLVWKKEQNNPNTSYQFKKIAGAKGVEVDCRPCLPILPMFTQ